MPIALKAKQEADRGDRLYKWEGIKKQQLLAARRTRRQSFRFELSERNHRSSIDVFAEPCEGQVQRLDRKDDSGDSANMHESGVIAVISDSEHHQRDHKGAKGQQGRDVRAERYREKHRGNDREGVERKRGGIPAFTASATSAWAPPLPRSRGLRMLP